MHHDQRIARLQQATARMQSDLDQTDAAMRDLLRGAMSTVTQGALSDADAHHIVESVRAMVGEAEHDPEGRPLCPCQLCQGKVAWATRPELTGHLVVSSAMVVNATRRKQGTDDPTL